MSLLHARQVQRLADSLQIDGASAGDTSGAGYTCEAAAFFHLYHVTSRVEQFKAALSEVRNLLAYYYHNVRFILPTLYVCFL